VQSSDARASDMRSIARDIPSAHKMGSTNAVVGCELSVVVVGPTFGSRPLPDSVHVGVRRFTT
jgi:hypothetical protein